MSIAPFPASTLASLDFLAGHWRCALADGVLEEMWMAPLAGVAQGSVRFVQNGAIKTIELIVIAAENDRVVLRYNHFHPDYRTWEDDGPIALTLTAAGAGSAIFSNLAQPARHAIEAGYRMTGPAALHSWVKPILADGSVAHYGFDYLRIA